MKNLLILIAFIPALAFGQSYEVRAEIVDAVVPAYIVRRHLSSFDMQRVGFDTIQVTRLFFIREDERIYLRQRDVVRITDNSKCYSGYTDQRIPCDLFLDDNFSEEDIIRRH